MPRPASVTVFKKLLIFALSCTKAAHKKRDPFGSLSCPACRKSWLKTRFQHKVRLVLQRGFELDRSLDFAGTKATGADAHSLRFAAAQIDADGEQVQLPATAGSAVRVADQVARSGSAATAVTYLGHVKAASFV